MMKNVTPRFRFARNLMIAVLASFSFSAANAHRIETFTVANCTTGANLTVDAITVFAGAQTWYNWQYRDNSGVWKCFTATSVINGQSFTVTGFAAQNVADNAPTLVIQNATLALENVQVRVLMRDNASPCGAPAGSVYGGDDLALNETKHTRLHIYTGAGDCGGTTPGCIGNVLNNAAGYYGGFENKTYSVANDTYTDNNFVSGAGSTGFTVGTGAGNYMVINNPYAMNTGYARNIAPHSGNFQMVVSGNTTVASKVWFKTVNVIAGNTYQFSAWTTRVNGSDANVSLRINGTELNSRNLATVTIGNWVEVTGSYTHTGAATTIEISIGDKNATATGGPNQYSLDDICFRLTGSIGNEVFNDANADGVKNNGEVGVAGVTVTLYDAGGKAISSTVTDAAGTYRFNGLNTSSAGVSYTVGFSLPLTYRFTALGSAITTDGNSDANLTTGRTGTITLTSTTPSVTYVDAGIYATVQSKIGDRVWNDVDRDGIQDAGEPGISGVAVSVYTTAGALVATTITSNNGFYSFTDLPANTYYLRIGHVSGYSLSAKNVSGTATATDNDFDLSTRQTSNFTVSATTVNLDLDGGLSQTTVRSSLGDFVWNDLNSDGLQNAGEPGVANVQVQLYSKTTNALVASTFTDAYGAYAFNSLLKSTYYIKFTLPAGFAFTTANVGADDLIDSDVDNSNGAGTTATISLDDNQIRTIYDAGIKSTTTTVTSLGDFVWYDLDKDGVQDAGEPGAPGITVQLYSTANVLVQTTATDKQGMYRFTGLTSGTSYIVAFGNLPVGYGFSPADQGASDAADSDVNPASGRTGTVVATANTAPLLTVDAGIILKPTTFDGRATVGDFVFEDLDSDGIQDLNEPGIAGVTVTLYDAAGTTVIATTATDARGKYVFNNLAAGSYLVQFSGYPAGYVATTQNAGTDKTRDSDAASANGRTAVFTLAAGEVNSTIDAGLRNTTANVSSLGNQVFIDINNNGVFDAATESGIAGISVSLLDVNDNLIDNTVTNENGLYTFTNLSAGTYKIAFGNLPTGYISGTRNVAGGTASVDNDSDPNVISFVTDEIVLAANTNDFKWDFAIRSTTVSFVGDKVFNDLDQDGVQDANEPGVGGVLVTLYNSGGTAIGSAVTDQNGIYIFTNVTPGSYTIGFSKIPGNTGFTLKNTTLNGGTTANDSDADATGRTSSFTVVAGQNKTDIDAGLISLFASVGDYVFRDVNSNGLQDATERGYAGITLTLVNASTNTPLTSAVSDGKGFYFFNNIPVAAAGTSFYIVLTGLLSNTSATTRYAGGTNLNSANNSDFSTVSGVIRTDNFTLTPGQNNPNVDAGIIAPDNTVVALNGLELAATLNKNVTTLKWFTETELNNHHFEIERSADGVNFTNEGSKSAVGTSNTRSNYETTDALGALAQKAVVYYRIKSVDLNGSFTYSNVVNVRPGKSATMEVYPNPFAAQLNIRIQSGDRAQVTVMITDSKGMSVRKSTATVNSGANLITYDDLRNLPNGVYTVRIVKDGETILSQMLVKN